MRPDTQSATTDPTESQRVIQSHESLEGGHHDAGAVPSNATRANPAAERLAQDFRNPQKIPFSKQMAYVYPHADNYISVQHKLRFPVIEDIIRQNLLENNKPSRKPPKTEYKLKMCGASIHAAQPSILVCHPSNDYKTGMSIMKILSRKQVKEQYDSRHTKAPRFKIYLFLGSSFTSLGRPMESLSIRIKDSYIPGALLVSGDGYDGISTIACGINFPNFDERIFALTSAHAFEEYKESDDSDTEDEDTVDTILVPDEDEEEGRETYTFAGIEYDISELMKYENINKQSPTSQVSVQHTNVRGHMQGHLDGSIQSSHVAVINPNRVWSRPQGSEWINSPNLDWALVEIEESDQWEPRNVDQVMHDIPEPSNSSRAVRILTSRGSLHGTICSIPTLIANSNDASSLCKVWTVTVEDSDTIFVGDSGALVIDTLTEQPYGYVIAINQFKELYIMPLLSVLNQISEMIAIPDVSPQVFMMLVPNPLLRLSSGCFKDAELTKNFSQYWPVEVTKVLSVDGKAARIYDQFAGYEGDLENKEQDTLPLQATFPAASVHENSTIFGNLWDTAHSPSAEPEDAVFDSPSVRPHDDTTQSSDFSTLTDYRSQDMSAAGLPSYALSTSNMGKSFPGLATNNYKTLNRRIRQNSYGLKSPTRSFDENVPLPRASNKAMSWALNKTIQNLGPNAKQSYQRQSSSRDIFDGPHQFLQPPAANILLLQERELPLLPLSLNVEEQSKVMKQVGHCLSQCAFDFFARYQLPIPLLRTMRPVEGPQDREWDEWVFLLKGLMARKRIPMRALLNAEVAQFEANLESSLGINNGAKESGNSLKDDRYILQLISASIHVAQMLKDASAMGELGRLYDATETKIHNHTKAVATA
ncbi:hypothetical protein TARUN_1377 [Trichoderma arundinaceum]|uniref:Uncharacterized protein n=1 Tax=Trichoderma arundinaceum TaxID=490622 RepID=A0A395NXG6_TRIAR|nr:hypothetical protein TARUN_1377 [Trichoderma arundinaceum]